MPSRYRELRAWESLNDFCVRQYENMKESGIFASEIRRAFQHAIGADREPSRTDFPDYLIERVDGNVFDDDNEWVFSKDNWNDPILAPLRDLARDRKTCADHGLVRYYDSDIETNGFLVHPNRDYAPYYLMTWYKDRGQTETFERSGTPIKLDEYVELIGDLLDEGAISLDVRDYTREDW